MRTIIDAFAEYERLIIGARTKAALAVKKARGERTGTVRYGFTADANGKLVPNAAEQAVLTQVRALRDAGLSHREIVAERRLAGLVSEDSQ
jgi:DNA invertase Pin-like site-specific DNA recombinase